MTGAASGIGEATKARLEAEDVRVVGVDIHDTDIEVDLSTADGRRSMVEQVDELTDGAIDVIYAVAGLSEPTPATAAVNYFGMVATLDGLHPLLLASPAPRAVAVTSLVGSFRADPELLDAMLSDDEESAIRRAEELATEPDTRGRLIYNSSKQAMSRWVRRQAGGVDWAGASIPLNAVAPGIIATPMSALFTATDEARATLLEHMPMPVNGIAPPEAVADLLVWLGSPVLPDHPTASTSAPSFAHCLAASEHPTSESTWPRHRPSATSIGSRTPSTHIDDRAHRSPTAASWRTMPMRRCARS